MISINIYRYKFNCDTLSSTNTLITVNLPSDFASSSKPVSIAMDELQVDDVQCVPIAKPSNNQFLDKRRFVRVYLIDLIRNDLS